MAHTTHLNALLDWVYLMLSRLKYVARIPVILVVARALHESLPHDLRWREFLGVTIPVKFLVDLIKEKHPGPRINKSSTHDAGWRSISPASDVYPFDSEISIRP